MPVYEYECSKCGHQFEAIKKIANRKDPEIEPCPECKEIAIEQRHFTPNLMGDAVRMGVSKHHVPDGFRDVLQSIKDKNPRSTIEIK